MKGCLSLLARLLASVCAILFVIATLAALLLFNVDQQLLTAEVYKRALAEQQLYERLPALVGEELALGATINPCLDNSGDQKCQGENSPQVNANPLTSSFASASPELQACLLQGLGQGAFEELASGQRQPKSSEPTTIRTCARKYALPPGGSESGVGAPLFAWMLEKEDWEAIFAALMPAEWLQRQTESVLDQLFSYLDSRTDSVKISLVDLKVRLRGEDGKNAALRIMRALPPCTEAQLAHSGNSAAGENWLACRPPEETILASIPDIQQSLADAVEAIPDEADLTPNLGKSSPSQPDPRGAFSVVRWIMRSISVVSFGLLILIALFGVRSLKGLLRWWGVPLLIVGLMGIILAIGLTPVVNQVIAVYAARTSTVLVPNLVQVILDVGRFIAGRFAFWIGVEAGALGLLGLAMLVVSFFVKRPSSAPQTATST